MKIVKVINNNVVSALDDQENEVVIMGRGIGFQKKPKELIDREKIQKIFVLNNSDEVGKFATLLKNLPLEHLQISTEIIEYAKKVMSRRLNPSIYITLTDHINFTIERIKNGILFNNALLEEVRSFYPSEYLIGEYAISLIEKELGVHLSVDEAASIALHIVNAEYNTGLSETMHITNMIRDVLDIVRSRMGKVLDEGSLYYSRFVTHLKFLAQRVFCGDLLDNQEKEFTDMICKLYPSEHVCSMEIGNYIEENYGHRVTAEELAYLTVHIRRIQPNVGDE